MGFVIAVTAAWWILLLTFWLTKTVYEDHVDLVSANRTLSASNKALLKELSLRPAPLQSNAPKPKATSETPVFGLTDEQAEELDARLSNYSESGKIDDFFYLSGDLQSKAIRDRLSDVLRRNNWKLPDRDHMGSLGGADFYGIRMYLNYNPTIPPYYIQLQKALTATGLSVDAKEFQHVDWKEGIAQLRIDVGHKKP